mmetsp:Transcript_5555/g.9766  ORF Transcript_5555/g.9766 Transcript_5555/m.9766 type:complete len:111 (-) Transcript_5555:127-459(-)
MPSTSELACAYACLILHDDGLALSEENIAKLTSEAGVSVESYYPGLFSKMASGMDMGSILQSTIGSASSPSGPAVAGANAGAGVEAPSEAKEEAKAEEEEEEEAEFDLFD